MSKKEFERNLDYGDCNNIFCFLGVILESVVGRVEDTITETKKIIDNSLNKQ